MVKQGSREVGRSPDQNLSNRIKLQMVLAAMFGCAAVWLVCLCVSVSVLPGMCHRVCVYKCVRLCVFFYVHFLMLSSGVLNGLKQYY